MKNHLKFFLLLILLVLLQSCAAKNKSVHGDKPLIDTAEIIVKGREEMDKKVIDGPKPYDTPEIPREDKRKTITTQNVKNYVIIPEEYTNLKQNISINFQGVDFKYAMSVFADLAEVNILVGDEGSLADVSNLDDFSFRLKFDPTGDTIGYDVDFSS